MRRLVPLHLDGEGGDDLADDTELEGAEAPVRFLMPLGGVEEWDRPGGPAHDPEGLAAMTDEVRRSMTVPVTEVDAHINDAGFAEAVVARIDAWREDGTLR